jgi:hypothetical protein
LKNSVGFIYLVVVLCTHYQYRQTSNHEKYGYTQEHLDWSVAPSAKLNLEKRDEM